MSRKAKQFGVNKQSKRRSGKKKRAPVAEPFAIIPRARATVVHDLFQNRGGQAVSLGPLVRELVRQSN